MQYLLSEEEYAEFANRPTANEHGAARQVLDMYLDVILKSQSFKCIHDEEQAFSRGGSRYCDFCPIVQLAAEKGADFGGKYRALQVMCSRKKDFSH